MSLWTKLKNWFKTDDTYVKYTFTKKGLKYKINIRDNQYTEFSTLLYMISSPVYVYKLIEDTKMSKEDKQIILDTYNLLIATESKLSQKMLERPVIKASEVLK